MTLDELKNEEDVVVESEGVRVIYESEIEELLSNSIIHYSNKFFERGFSIKGSKLSSC